MHSRRFILTTLTVVVLLLAGSGLAVASSDVPVSDEAAVPDETVDQGDLIGWWLDLPSLLWWFLPVNDELPKPECIAPDTDDAAPPSGEPELAEGCYEVPNVEGPNGQVTHGSVVSAFVHFLKMAEGKLDYEGPKGQLVRDIARSDLGKGLDDLDEVPDSDDFESEAADEAKAEKDRPGPPEHARGEGHGKKDKPNKKPKK